MVGSRDLEPSTTPFFPNVLFNNEFRAKPKWPAPNTNLSGKTAIITGGNTGLDFKAAVQLLSLQLSHLILPVRYLPKGEEAGTTLRQRYPHAQIEVWSLDMSQYNSILAFANRVTSQLSRIDIVLLNAGVIRLDSNLVQSTGHEETLQVNC